MEKLHLGILKDSSISALEKQTTLWSDYHFFVCVEELIELDVVDRNQSQEILDLIFNEIRLREMLNQDFSEFMKREYQLRFPCLSDEIRKQFEYEKHVYESIESNLIAVGPECEELGIQIDGYRIIEKIARGGFGTVYKAEQLDLNRIVAIKVIMTQDLRKGFPFTDVRQEAWKASRLFHKNIIEIYEIGEKEAFFFIVMPFVDGGSLVRNRLKLKGKYDEITRIMVDVAHAVQYAHDLEILHCDITPSNILLGYGCRPLLVDFGLAQDKMDRDDLQIISSSLNNMKVRPNSKGEKFGFDSPEQRLSDTTLLSEKTDVFGLGVVLYYLITCSDELTLTTENRTGRDVFHARQTPRDLVAICDKCLKNNPEDRYASAEEFASDLGRFLSRKPVNARPLNRCRNIPERFVKWTSRSPVIALLSASLLVFGLLLLITLVGGFVYTTKRAYELSDALKKTAVTSFDLGKLAASSGTIQQAIESYQQSIAVQEQLMKVFPYSERNRLQLAKTFNNLALALGEISASEEQSMYFKRSIEMLTNYVVSPDLAQEWHGCLADFHENCGNNLLRLNRRGDAMKEYEIASDIRGGILARGSPDYIFGQAKSMIATAGIDAFEIDRLGDALNRYRMAIELLEELLPKDTQDIVFEKLQITQMNYCNLVSRFESSPQAATILKDIISKWEAAVEVAPEDHRARRLLALSYANYGYFLSQIGEYSMSVDTLKKGRSHFVYVMDNEKGGLITEIYFGACLNFLSNSCRISAQTMYNQADRKKSLDASFKFCKEAIEILSRCVNQNRLLHESRGRLIDAHRNLGGYYLMQGDFELSIKSYRDAIALVEQVPDVNLGVQCDRIAIFNDMSRAMLDSSPSAVDDARILFEQGLREGQELAGKSSSDIVVQNLLQVLNDGLGLVYFRKGFSSAEKLTAEEFYMQSIKYYTSSIVVAERLRLEQKLSGDHVRILAETYGRRATVFDLVGMFADSEKDWEVLIQRCDRKHPDFCLFRLSRAIALARIFRRDSAWEEFQCVEADFSSNGYAAFMAAVFLCEFYTTPGDENVNGKKQFVGDEDAFSRVISYLHDAEHAGYFNTESGLASLRDETGFELVREMNGFKEFVERLQNRDSVPSKD
jgi:serine/threonine protein kinase